jgi:hypothetical protein
LIVNWKKKIWITKYGEANLKFNRIYIRPDQKMFQRPF